MGLDAPEHTVDAFVERMKAFLATWGKRYPSFKRQLPEAKWAHYSAYLHYPFAVRRMLYTTNWIERLNKEVCKITRHVNSFPTSESAVNLVFMATRTIDETTYAKPLTAFYAYREQMDAILYGDQTHKT